MTSTASLSANKKPIDLKNAEIILYSVENNRTKVDAIFYDQTLWMSQKKMALLFGVWPEVITDNLKSTFTNKDLKTSPNFTTLELKAPDGNILKTRYYNLDAVVAVGFLVNSRQTTQFCTWANQSLRDFLAEGLIIDKEHLEEGKQYFADFEQLVETIELANIETKGG
jgi:hypothetical protein